MEDKKEYITLPKYIVVIKELLKKNEKHKNNDQNPDE